MESRGDAQPLIDRWHEHADRRYEPDEFRTYWKAISKGTFVREALNPPAAFDPQVTFAEALAVLDAVRRVETSQSAQTYYLHWLEKQFPDCRISDLIYWPDEWFGDASLFRNPDGSFKSDVSLSGEEMLSYAMAKSGRRLQGAPEVSLPFPLPNS
ncbi:hypothetical protein [Anatilimnocola floriformis]|uniref:hypothetical protein n=1 Tax=Anatilimnocola floriformis TaxID=2948575 RepID=UPI0020C3DE9C|nr:hypothetical protein [Anatilimnocola floriformis]